MLLITGNKEKIAAARMFMDVEARDIECPEIQTKDVSEIAAFSAEWAANKLQRPVIKNDCALEIEAWNGFPGPFVAFVERWIGAGGFLNIMQGVSNRRAQFRDATAVCLPGEKAKVFTSVTKGEILTEPRGEHGWEIDKIFAIDGKSLGEYTDAERVKLYNNDHWKQAAEWVRNQ